MNKWINFLRNPWFASKTKLITLDKAGGIIQKTKEETSNSPFAAEPWIILFSDY